MQLQLHFSAGGRKKLECSPAVAGQAAWAKAAAGCTHKEVQKVLFSSSLFCSGLIGMNGDQLFCLVFPEEGGKRRMAGVHKAGF